MSSQQKTGKTAQSSKEQQGEEGRETIGREQLPPWLLSELDRLLTLFDRGHLHHALLLTGRSGLGKRWLADALGRALLCQAGSDRPRPCGVCRGCQLTAGGTHPDQRILGSIGPNENGERGEIVVDAVRRLIDFLHLSAQMGGNRVALIVPCDRLNKAAANSLLKSLEEPPAGVFLILATGRPARLPATVRSRCAVHPLRTPAPAAAQAWLAERNAHGAERIRRALALTGGMPLTAEEILRHHGLDQLENLLQQLHRLAAGSDPIKEAEAWQDETHALAETLATLVAELVRLRYSDVSRGLLTCEMGERLRAATQGVPLAALHQAFEQLTEHRRHLEQPLNGRLAAETLFLDLAAVLHPST